MKSVLILVAICLIGAGVYFGFIHKPPSEKSGEGVEIIPGIKARFTSNEDAGQYYGKMMRSFLARRTGIKNPKNLTEDESKWFTLATNCRKCSLYPEQFPHIMPNAPVPELNAFKDIAELMGGRARSLWLKNRDREALDILTRIGIMGWHIEKENEDLMSNLAGFIVEWTAQWCMARFYEARGQPQRVAEYEEYIEAKKKSLVPLREVSRPIDNWADFEWFKSTAVSHNSALWRKGACLGLTHPFVLNNPQARAQALQVLKTVAQNDRDPVVREFASACVPYVAGTKATPPSVR